MSSSVAKIDIHSHVVPNSKKSMKRWVDDEALLNIYDKLNIEKGVVLPFLMSGDDASEATNVNAKLVTAMHPKRFLRFASVDLDCCDNLYEFLREEKESGALGVGEITSNVYFDDPRVDILFSACEKLELPVLFHMSPVMGSGYGLVDGLGLPRLEKMLIKYPKVKVIGHSQPFWCEISKIDTESERNAYPKGKIIEGRLPELMRKCENLYCDLSAGSGANAMMRDGEYAAKFMTEFSDRILYGCDITSTESAYPFEFAAFLDRLLEAKMISEKVYKKICRENAIRLLKIEA
jgi:predicted TIM-barrel fold metal-dependent hydrolase